MPPPPDLLSFCRKRCIYFHLMCILCVSVHHVVSERRSEKGAGFPRTEVTSVCELTCGCWESKPGPPQGQQVLLTSGCSGPLFLFFCLFVCLVGKHHTTESQTQLTGICLTSGKLSTVFSQSGLVLELGLTLRFRSRTFCFSVMTGKAAIATPRFARLLKRWR